MDKLTDEQLEAMDEAPLQDLALKIRDEITALRDYDRDVRAVHDKRVTEANLVAKLGDMNPAELRAIGLSDERIDLLHAERRKQRLAAQTLGVAGVQSEETIGTPGA